MSDLKFHPTHRILIAATSGNHGYDMVDIDANNGTFYRVNVGADGTKIRAKQGIHAEVLCYNGDGDYNLPLKDATAIKIVKQFNDKRAELDFQPLEFWRLGEHTESSEL